jgi:hypothetical protein
VAPADAAALLAAAPQLAAVGLPAVVGERTQALADALGVARGAAVGMVGRQPMLWTLPPRDVRCPVPLLAGRLGVSEATAAGLAERMPVLLALEPDAIALSVGAAAAATGLGEAPLLELVARHPPLVAVPAELLGPGLDRLAAELRATPEAALDVVTRQPTLLLTAPANVAAAAELIASVLCAPEADGLRVVAAQPWLLYDQTAETLAARVAHLGELFGGGVERGRAIALEQPVSGRACRGLARCRFRATEHRRRSTPCGAPTLLPAAPPPCRPPSLPLPSQAMLALSPATVAATAAGLEARLGLTPAQALPLMLADPGGALATGFLGGGAAGARLSEAWASQLGIGAGGVAALLGAQPALVEVPPNTLRARLEGIGALLDAPAAAVAQLALKHAGIVAVPPNAIITRAKNLATALGCSMARAGELIAKAPAVLALPSEALRSARIEAAAAAAALGPAAPAGALHERLLDVCAAYEFFTAQWIAAAAKQRAPARGTSFSALHR